MSTLSNYLSDAPSSLASVWTTGHLRRRRIKIVILPPPLVSLFFLSVPSLFSTTRPPFYYYHYPWLCLCHRTGPRTAWSGDFWLKSISINCKINQPFLLCFYNSYVFEFLGLLGKYELVFMGMVLYLRQF